MTDDFPRDLEPTPEERLKTVVARAAAGTGLGATLFGRRAGQQSSAQEVGLFPSGLARLAAVTGPPSSSISSLPSSSYQSANSWGPGVYGFDEDASNGLIVADDSGGIYVFEEGIYAWNLFLNVGGIGAASSDCVIHAFIDVPQPFGTGFGCTVRGGDPEPRSLLPSTSRTYYDPGIGFDGGNLPGISWVNLDTAHVTDISLEIQVQRIV